MGAVRGLCWCWCLAGMLGVGRGARTGLLLRPARGTVEIAGWVRELVDWRSACTGGNYCRLLRLKALW